MSLLVKNLSVDVGGKRVLQSVSLEIKSGEVVVLMGPNGSGKSSLGLTIAGHPYYQIVEGSIKIDSVDVTRMSVDERARAGLFLLSQYPTAIPGVNVKELMLAALRQKEEGGKMTTAIDLKNEVLSVAKSLLIKDDLIKRGINDGFSGGEKKRMETLQMIIMKPKYAIVDEVDSGLDVDGLRVVAKAIGTLVKNKQMGTLVITHYQRLLKYLEPDKVFLLKEGNVVRYGGSELVDMVERDGFSGREAK